MIDPKNFRKNLLGFGGGGGGGGVGEGGGGVDPTLLGEGGVRGTFCGGIVDVEVGVAGVGEADLELKLVDTGPTGGGWFVVELADPGRTTGFESDTLGLSAYPL